MNSVHFSLGRTELLLIRVASGAQLAMISLAGVCKCINGRQCQLKPTGTNHCISSDVAGSEWHR